MKVKELRKKYKGYKIIEMGYPDSIPFTMLPKEVQGLYGKELVKAIDELEVKGFKVYEHPHTDIDITHLVLGGPKRLNPSYKGTVEIYLVSNKKKY